MTDLDTITSELGSSYKGWKDNEKEKERLRKEFFDEATATHKKKTLARKTVRINSGTKEEAWELASKEYARWKILSIEYLGSARWTFTLEEDPEFKPFVYVNFQDGQVYKKEISEPGAIIDTERIQKEDPEFWEEITFVPKPSRQLKALEDLTKDQYKELQQYAYKPKPQVKLAAPRKAKPEELEDV